MTPEEKQAKLERLKKLKRLRELRAQKAQMEVVSEGGPDTVFGVQIPNEQQIADHKRYHEIGRNAGVFGPSWNDRKEFNDLYMKREGKTMMPQEAVMTRATNSALFGIPSMVNDDMKDLVGTAGREYENLSLGGDVLGFLAPGAAIGKVASKVGAPIMAALPKGADKLSRGIRYGARATGLSALGAAENAAFEATTRAAAKEAETGEDVDRLEAAREGATNPYALMAGPALSGGLRLGKYVKSGGRTFTPESVSGVVDPRMTAGRGQILDAELFGAVDPGDEARLIRMLTDAGYSRDDILAATDKLAQPARELGSEGSVGLPLLPNRLKDVLVDRLGDGAQEPIDDFLRGTGNAAGTEGATTVRAGVGEDAKRYAQFLDDSADARFGQGTRFNAERALDDQLSDISSEGYEAAFANAPPEGTMDKLGGVLAFYKDASLTRPLKELAQGQMQTLDDMIAKDPRRAAHWMQHTARTKAEALERAGKTVEAQAYNQMRTNLLNALEPATPGYAQARKAYGDVSMNKAALNKGRRFLSETLDPYNVDKLEAEVGGFSPSQDEAFRLSVRDAVKKSMSQRAEGGAPRLALVNREPVLNAMERTLGDEGAAFGEDVKKVAERLNRNRHISTAGPNTMNKGEARRFAEQMVSNPMSRKVTGALDAFAKDSILSSLTGVPSPLMTARATAGSLSKALKGGRQAKMDSLTRLLMSDVTPPVAAPGGPFPPSAANLPKLPTPIPTTPAPAPQKNPYLGRKSFRTESAKDPVENSFVLAGMFGESVAGGAVGGAIPVDYNGDGQINMADRAIGATIGASVSPTARGMRRVKDRMMGSGGLPKGTVRAVNGNTDIYDVPTKAGPIEFGVQLPEYRGMAALPRQIRKAADMNRQYLGSTAPVAKAQAVGEVPDMILDQADAKRAYGSGDAAEVSWNWADGRPSEYLNARKIHDAFEQSFRAFEDHAIRHRQPVYSFSGLSDAHTRLYKRRLSQPGALPRGYEAFEVGGNFYVVKNGDRRLLKKAIENYDDPENVKKISKAAIAQ